jgi:ABC-2 type transport system permease protein
MSALWWLTRKNLLIFFSDKRGASMTVLLPLVLGTLMGALMSPRAGPSDLALLVVQEDDSAAVTALVDAIDAHEMFTVERVDEAQARARVGSGSSSLALLLPNGTGASLEPWRMFGGERSEVTILHDPSRAVRLSIARGLLTQVLMQEMGSALTDPSRMQDTFRRIRADLDTAREADPGSIDPTLLEFIDRGSDLADSLASDDEAQASNDREGPEDADAPEPAAQGSALQPPIELVAEPITASGPTSGYNHYAHNYAGMLLIFLLFAGTSSAQSLLKEREGGVLHRIRLSSANAGTVLLSTGASTSVIAMLSSLLVYAVGIAAFGIEVRGPMLGFALVLVAQSILVGGFAVLLAGVGRSEKQVSGLSTLIVLPAALLGGAMLPSFLFPDWVQAVQPLIPTYWATHGLAAMTWRGSGWAEAVLSAGALLGFAALFAAIGVRRFDWDAE